VEDAAGVDDEVGGIKDAGRLQPGCVVGRGQLVVRGPGDDPAAKRADRRLVEDPAEGTRGQDVAWLR
jgi:hypothetical protein